MRTHRRATLVLLPICIGMNVFGCGLDASGPEATTEDGVHHGESVWEYAPYTSATTVLFVLDFEDADSSEAVRARRDALQLLRMLASGDYDGDHVPDARIYDEISVAVVGMLDGPHLFGSGSTTSALAPAAAQDEDVESFLDDVRCALEEGRRARSTAGRSILVDAARAGLGPLWDVSRSRSVIGMHERARCLDRDACEAVYTSPRGNDQGHLALVSLTGTEGDRDAAIRVIGLYAADSDAFRSFEPLIDAQGFARCKMYEEILWAHAAPPCDGRGTAARAATDRGPRRGGQVCEILQTRLGVDDLPLGAGFYGAPGTLTGLAFTPGALPHPHAYVTVICETR